MPIVRLAGQTIGRKDPNRRMRARLLYRLFDAGWDIWWVSVRTDVDIWSTEVCENGEYDLTIES